MKIRYLMAAALLAVLNLAPAVSQTMPSYEKTGVLTAVIDGRDAQYHTTTNTVPGQAGRNVHTASWRRMTPMQMGGISIGPDGIFVSLTGNASVPPQAGDASLKITFLIDKSTHELDTSTPFEVVYISEQSAGAVEYRHKEGTLELISVVPGDDDIFEITGRAEGRLQASSDAAEVDYQADFQVRAHPLTQ